MLILHTSLPLLPMPLFSSATPLPCHTPPLPHPSSYTPLSFPQPQNCIPDVIVWMLAGNKRVAVKRIPSNELMYSPIAKARGKYCGKLQVINLTVSHAQHPRGWQRPLSLPPPTQPPAVKKQKELEDMKDRAQVRLMLWLGLEKDQTKWTDNIPGGDLATFAETVRKWGSHSCH